MDTHGKTSVNYAGIFIRDMNFKTRECITMINKTNIRIPKKYQEGIEEVFHDSDGYWVHAKEGYNLANTDFNVQIVQCDTQSQVLDEIRAIEKMEEIS